MKNGYRQSKATEPGFTRSFAPTQWESVNVPTARLGRTELR
jgi:hypothetical protein